MIRAASCVRDELGSPATWPDFFAFVAAADVLGVRAAIAGRDGVGAALWVGALAISALAATGLLRAERASQLPHLPHTLVTHAAAVTWALAAGCGQYEQHRPTVPY